MLPNVSTSLKGIPQRQSRFTTLLTSVERNWKGVVVERIVTSPGYNTSTLSQHVLGVHLGAPVTILHRRDRYEETYSFKQGDIVFAPVGTPIYYAHSEPVDALYIVIDPHYFLNFTRDLGALDQSVNLRDRFGAFDSTLERIGGALLEELSQHQFGEDLYVHALTQQLFLHLLRHYVGIPIDNEMGLWNGHPQPLRFALQYIAEHLGEKLLLEDIAGSVNLSPYYFSRVFKNTYSMSPYQYVLQQRIRFAQRLLQNPKLDLAEIAIMTGFVDSSHLTRHFKRATGTTPGAVQRKNIQESGKNIQGN